MQLLQPLLNLLALQDQQQTLNSACAKAVTRTSTRTHARTHAHSHTLSLLERTDRKSKSTDGPAADGRAYRAERGREPIPRPREVQYA